MAISDNWLFLWDKIPSINGAFYGFLSTYNWYNLGHNCSSRVLHSPLLKHSVSMAAETGQSRDPKKTGHFFGRDQDPWCCARRRYTKFNKLWLYIYIYTCMCMYVYIYICICKYIYIYTYLYVYIYIHMMVPIRLKGKNMINQTKPYCVDVLTHPNNHQLIDEQSL